MLSSTDVCLRDKHVNISNQLHIIETKGESMKTFKSLCSVSLVAAAFVTITSLPQANAGPSGDMTYESFLDSCKNPAAYGAQRPPENIRVSCKNVHSTWVPIEAGGTALSETRNLSTELFSDKYHVVLQSFEVETPEFNIACPRYREVIETSQIDKSLTCEQVLAETRGLKEICLDAIDEAILANKDLVEVVATGKTFSGCSGVVQKP